MERVALFGHGSSFFFFFLFKFFFFFDLHFTANLFVSGWCSVEIKAYVFFLLAMISELCS